MNLKYTQHQQQDINQWEENLKIIACTGPGKTNLKTRRTDKLLAIVVQTREINAFFYYKE